MTDKHTEGLVERLREALAVIAYEAPGDPSAVAHDALKFTAVPLGLALTRTPTEATALADEPVDRNAALEEAARLVETHAYVTTGGNPTLEPNKNALFDSHHKTIATAIRALRTEASAQEGEPCVGCGDPDCDFDCDGEYDPAAQEGE